MTRTIRHLFPEIKWSHRCSPALFQPLLSDQTIGEALTDSQAWEQRERKLNMVATIWIAILLTLAPRMSVTRFLTSLFEPMEQFDETDQDNGWTEGAWRARRKQLPVKVFQHLLVRMHHPRAPESVPGVFWRGWCVMAIDSTLEDVAATPVNIAHFGRITSGKSQSPFPQVRGTYLIECGTHRVIDAALTPCRVSEVPMAYRLTRSIRAGMLVLLDRGFCASQLYHLINASTAQVLALVPCHVLKTPEVFLPDGSYLATLSKGRNCRGKAIRLRVIAYTVHLDGKPDNGKTYRLVTTLLDPETAPAEELIRLYHQRWSIETTILEIDRQQSILHQPLRSKTPEAILKELYSVLIGHNLVRSLMLEAASVPGKAPEAPTHYSFSQVITQLQAALRSSVQLAPEDLPRMKACLLDKLRQTRLPRRRKTLRWYPRVVKRLYSKFPPKRAKHVGLMRADLTWESILSLST